MNTMIQWTTAKYWQVQWNYAIGCHKVSPACQNCWASEWAKRFMQSFEPHCSSKKKPPKKGICFVGNLSDMFGEWCDRLCPPEYYIGQAVESKSKATFLWLTKRPQRMVRALRSGYDRGDRQVPFCECNMSNQYFGFTAENQEWYDKRYSEFRKIPTCFKGWLSAEPLLGHIDLGLEHVYPEEAMPFNWVVVGCESGANRRPCKIEWVENIVEQCRSHHVPVFVKQICLSNGKFTNKIEDFPKHLQIRHVPWAKNEEDMKCSER